MFARACFLISLLLFAGCVTPRHGVPLPDLGGWETRTEVLGSLRHWEFKGRIAVKAGDEGFNGKLRWKQNAEEFRATVSGPLGIGTVRIEGDGRSASLTDNDGVRTELGDVESELQYRYGWTIPVASLRYWALGIPDPTIPAETEFGDDGQLASMRQANWQVDFTQYREGGGQLLPRRLNAVNDDVRVRLVIDNWVFR